MSEKNKPELRIPDELIDSLLANCEPSEILSKDGLLKQLTARLVERVLEGELSSHLGYEKGDPDSAKHGNSRNGKTRKKVKTDSCEVEISTPRDREGTFEPQLVKKRQTRLKGLDEKIIALYARGMTTRDIQGHLEEAYGVEVSPDLISRATSAVIEDVRAWQSRPLETVYPIVYLDALVVKVRDEGVVRNKSVFLALGVTLEGSKEVLGMWIEKTEGAKFWLKILNELRTRGVEDVLIVCCDGLKGFPDAIEHVFPQATVQTCIVHMIRNSLRYVSYKDRKAVAKDLKVIYTSPSREAARGALDDFQGTWGDRYPLIHTSWDANWERVAPFLDFPEEIRKVIYTTNAIESMNSSLRKLLQHRGHFPTDDAVYKILYLAFARYEKKWRRSMRNWNQVLGQFAILFEGRIPNV